MYEPGSENVAVDEEEPSRVWRPDVAGSNVTGPGPECLYHLMLSIGRAGPRALNCRPPSASASRSLSSLVQIVIGSGTPTVACIGALSMPAGPRPVIVDAVKPTRGGIDPIAIGQRRPYAPVLVRPGTLCVCPAWRSVHTTSPLNFGGMVTVKTPRSRSRRAPVGPPPETGGNDVGWRPSNSFGSMKLFGPSGISTTSVALRFE